MRLEGKVALVTGGAAGIGKATAARFVREGATVAICDVNDTLGEATAEEIGATYDSVNTADRAAVVQWVADVVEEFGRIDILINNAGITRDGLFVKVKNGEVVRLMSEDQFDAVIDVNLKGVFNCAQSVTPYMIKQGGGVIVNASSVVGLDGNFGQTNYVAAKAGVIGMTKVWARELGRHNIRVNAIAPGFTQTAMTSAMPQHILDTIVKGIPLRRAGQPEDIANAYLFLASDEAAFISGVTLRVDGGAVNGTA